MKINFTKEHKARLDILSIDALIGATIFKGTTGTTLTVWDLYHNTSLNTLSKLLVGLKKEVDEIENMDVWSLNQYQQDKKKDLQERQELISLITGYKRYQEEKSANRAALKLLKDEYNLLKENNKTPEVRMQEMEAKIAAAELETA